ncbi:MAG: hypothetical protein WC505_06985 [Patescibacteria group bacterium]
MANAVKFNGALYVIAGKPAAGTPRNTTWTKKQFKHYTSPVKMPGVRTDVIQGDEAAVQTEINQLRRDIAKAKASYDSLLDQRNQQYDKRTISLEATRSPERNRLIRESEQKILELDAKLDRMEKGIERLIETLNEKLNAQVSETPSPADPGGLVVEYDPIKVRKQQELQRDLAQLQSHKEKLLAVQQKFLRDKSQPMSETADKLIKKDLLDTDDMIAQKQHMLRALSAPADPMLKD